ncbi:hypothetical protein RSAG8_01922, partial [Rhizoctonia solani AG-8 WAC10335]
MLRKSLGRWFSKSGDSARSTCQNDRRWLDSLWHSCRLVKQWSNLDPICCDQFG